MATSLQTWYVFSDGACEREQGKTGSIGAVLVNSAGQAVSFFEGGPTPFVETGLKGGLREGLRGA